MNASTRRLEETIAPFAHGLLPSGSDVRLIGALLAWLFALIARPLRGVRAACAVPAARAAPPPAPRAPRAHADPAAPAALFAGAVAQGAPPAGPVLTLDVETTPAPVLTIQTESPFLPSLDPAPAAAPAVQVE